MDNSASNTMSPLMCDTIKRYQKILYGLLNQPKLKQKSKEWYEMRHNMITASDFAQALGEGKFGTQKQLIEKKCLPLSTEDNKAFSKSNVFFAWGNMFEPVATMIYSKMMNVYVHEFGLLPHPKYKFFGASPDGISDLGVMLEIKCPFKRKITGDIPTQYYYQIQGQLDVCDLDECDYFECEFLRFEDYEEYVSSYNTVSHKGFTGIITSSDNNDTFSYGEVYDKCVDKCVAKVADDNVYYWVLREYNLKRVIRDKVFVNDRLKKLESIWNKILFYREHPERFELEVKGKIQLDTQLSHLAITHPAARVNDENGRKKQKCMIVDLE